MTRDPILFARECNTRGPCAQFVSAWLRNMGVSGAPSDRDIWLDWARLGINAGVVHWCEKLALSQCDPQPLAVSLVRQSRGGHLLGIIAPSDLFVTRSFCRVLIVREPRVIGCWRV